MNIVKLILMVSEDCNFHCQYCFQTKENKQMEWTTAKRSLDFFLNQKPNTFNLYFLGGEPLLNYSLIKDIVEYLEEKKLKSKKKVHYNVSTNGSLINEEVLEFFNQHHFTVELSFDGLAQEKGRKKRSFKQLLQVIEKLKKQSNIKLLVNSVFTSNTVEYMSDSINYILALGISNASLGLAIDKQWNKSSIERFENELKRLMKLLLIHYKQTGNQPLHLFPDLRETGIWCCSAGRSQITITAEGEIWGCSLFYEYFKNQKNSDIFKDYYFGTIDEFIKSHKKKYQKISKNYNQLCMDNFYTHNSRCFLCPNIEKCGVCPVSSAFFHNELEKVPDHICQINQIAIKEKEKLLHNIKMIDDSKK